MYLEVFRTKKVNNAIISSVYLYKSPDECILQCCGLENYDFLVTPQKCRCMWEFSPKFNKNLISPKPIGRRGIRIHSANSACQLRGCLAVGTLNNTGNGLINSRHWIECLRRYGKQIDSITYYNMF